MALRPQSTSTRCWRAPLASAVINYLSPMYGLPGFRPFDALGSCASVATPALPYSPLCAKPPRISGGKWLRDPDAPQGACTSRCVLSGTQMSPAPPAPLLPPLGEVSTPALPELRAAPGSEVPVAVHVYCWLAACPYVTYAASASAADLRQLPSGQSEKPPVPSDSMPCTEH